MTRAQIQVKVDELNDGEATVEEVYNGLSAWLTSQNVPSADREAILADLESYL